MNKLYFIFGIIALAMGSFVIASRFFAMPHILELMVPIALLLVIIVLVVLILAKRSKSN